MAGARLVLSHAFMRELGRCYTASTSRVLGGALDVWLSVRKNILPEVRMTRPEIEKAVRGALADVQEMSGRESHQLKAGEKPISSLEGFDSLGALEATAQIEVRLGKKLPIDFCAFISKSGKRALTVAEACESVAAALGLSDGSAKWQTTTATV